MKIKIKNFIPFTTLCQIEHTKLENYHTTYLQDELIYLFMILLSSWKKVDFFQNVWTKLRENLTQKPSPNPSAPFDGDTHLHICIHHLYLPLEFFFYLNFFFLETLFHTLIHWCANFAKILIRCTAPPILVLYNNFIFQLIFFVMVFSKVGTFW